MHVRRTLAVLVGGLLVRGRSAASSSLIAPTGKRAVTLITFDVDGTLVQGSSEGAQRSVHARSFAHAVGKVFGQKTDWELTVPSPTMVIPPARYHGSTDGIIALNLAHFGYGIHPSEAIPQLQRVFREMTKYVSTCSDEEVASGIDVLPGVMETLRNLALPRYKGRVLVGLVTGNVEKIARIKMRALGITQTNVFAPPAASQVGAVSGDGFLGCFGSCFCSGIIDDPTYLWKDRGEQIKIAVRRARSLLAADEELVRVVHVGDAPSDILAAKFCAESGDDMAGLEVGMIAVATGKFSPDELRSHTVSKAACWDCIVLERGLAVAPEEFINFCKIRWTNC